MRGLLTLLPLLLGACAQGAARDLPYVKQARSVAAEWAMVNDQAAKARLTDQYVKSMHGDLRQELGTAGESISNPAYAAVVNAILALPDDAPPARLRAGSHALKQIEDQLESD